MRLLACGWLVVVLVVAEACGGAVATIGDADGDAGGGRAGGSSSGGGGRGSSSGSSGVVAPPGSACAAPPSPGASDPCAPVAGVYYGHYVKDPSSSAGCVDGPSLDGPEQVDPNGTSDAGPGCATSEDRATCDGTIICVDSSGGATTKTVLTYSTCGVFEGTIAIDATGSGADMHCRYTFTLTKQ
jgi:hypothetical protein